MELCGVRTIGNKKLLKQKKIAVFASRNVRAETLMNMLDWANNITRDMCIIGPFHSRLEREVFRLALERGAKVIWLLGRSLPTKFSATEVQAFKENRLLVISCFNRDHHNLATARYCNHLAILYAKVVVFGALEKSQMLTWLQRRCKRLKKKVVLL